MHAEIAHRMREQAWMINNMISLTGPDICWGMSNIANFQIGGDVAGDITAIRGMCRKYEDISPAYARYAAKREEMAKRAEAEGHLVTAADSYYAAAFFYGCAMFPIHEDDNKENIAFNAKKIACYNKFIKYSRRPIERVELPFEGKSLAGLLHLPPNRTGKVPCVLDLVGMDGFKEQSNSLYGEKHVERGFAVFTLDYPGHGEALINKIYCTTENVVRAYKQSVDYLLTRPEIDANNIFVSGISFASFWPILIAGNDHRIKAMATRLFCHEPGFDTLFNTNQPAFKARFIWMAGCKTEAEFDQFAKTLTWKGVADKIQCPVFMVGGECDNLSPIENTFAIFNTIQTPKKLMIFKGEGHSVPSSWVDCCTIVTDWMRDRYEGKPMAQSEIVYTNSLGQIIKQ
jgi:cephalosporin-C deacetylase-like acetyl esterase